jgi:hypothetical protein
MSLVGVVHAHRIVTLSEIPLLSERLARLRRYDGLCWGCSEA